MDKNISLNVKCPICGKSLMDSHKQIDDKPSLKLLITNGENSGTIWFSSVYGSYNFNSDIEVMKGDIATFSCPKCGHEIKSSSVCEECSAPMIRVCLPEGGKVAFCTRAGCKKHYVEIEDLETAINHFYQDFSYANSSDKQ